LQDSNVEIDSKNYIVDGGFTQSSTGASFPNPSGYTLDVWLSHEGDGTGIASQEEFTPGQTDVAGNPSNYFKFVQTVAVTANHDCLTGRIKRADTLSNEVVGISFDAWGTEGKEIALTLSQDFGTGGSPSSTSSQAFGPFELSAAKQRLFFSGTVADVSGKTFGTDVGSDFLAVRLRETSSYSTFEINVANMYLHKGDTAKEFPREDGVAVSDNVKEFFERISNTAGGGAFVDKISFGGGGVFDTSTQAQITLPYSKKRVVPDITHSGTGTFEVSGASVETVNSITQTAKALSSSLMTVGTSSGGDGDGAILRANSTGETYFDIDARF
jgi:hypothetical protein